MTLVTGTPVGLINAQEDTYISGAPNIWMQDTHANPLNNPDSDGFYWGMSGTTQYPVIAIGCVEGVALADNLTTNDIICDTVGVTDSILRRNFLEMTLTISTILPLSSLRDIMRTGLATVSNHVEKVGFGPVDQARRIRVYAAKVYDEGNGYYLNFTLHKARFVDAWSMGFRYANQWQLTGLKIRAYADTTKPAAQQFATMLRSDAGAL